MAPRPSASISAGSAAIPGMIPGLFTALEKWGSWSIADVAAPAIMFLNEGAVLGPRQAAMAQFLEPILIDKVQERICAQRPIPTGWGFISSAGPGRYFGITQSEPLERCV